VVTYDLRLPEWKGILAVQFGFSMRVHVRVRDAVGPGGLNPHDVAVATSPARSSSLVNITTEAAMLDGDGRVIRDCLEPHITRFGDTYFAYGYINGPGPYATTCYSSKDLSVWVRESSFPMLNGSAGGQPNIWWYVSVLYNKKNDEYVAFGGGYGHRMDRYQSYTSKTPTGPFVLRRTMSAVFGGPGDSTFFADDDGKAYVAYNAADGVVPFDTVSRFTYIYQLSEDYSNIDSSTLCNTSVSMEGLWLMKNRGTYYLLGSGLVNYDVDDDFYLTAPTPLGPWTYRGYVAPVGSRTFHSQTFKGLTVQGSQGVAHVFIGDRWCNPPMINATCDRAQPGNLSTWCCWPPFADAISIWLPLSFAANGSLVPMHWHDHWLLDTDGWAGSSATAPAPRKTDDTMVGQGSQAFPNLASAAASAIVAEQRAAKAKDGVLRVGIARHSALRYGQQLKNDDDQTAPGTTFDTVMAAAASTIEVDSIAVFGHHFAGDGGAAIYKKLGAAPKPVTLAHFQTANKSWFQLNMQEFTPEMFGARGDGKTSDSEAFNAMFEFVPSGALCSGGPKQYRISKTNGTNYAIRIRKAIRFIGCGAPSCALAYDNTLNATDHAILVQPPGIDVMNGVTANIYTILGLEIAHWHIAPFAESLGFVLTIFGYNSSLEYCNYGRHVIHVDARPATKENRQPTALGVGRMHMHDLYVFSSGGLGGGIGDGASINIDAGGDPHNVGSIYMSRVENVHTSGGIRFRNIGDSNQFNDLRLDGKGGIIGTALSSRFGPPDC
jgi:hypothetical protein